MTEASELAGDLEAPADLILALATYPPFPRAAVEAARRQRAAMAPAFIDTVEACIASPEEIPPHGLPVLLIFHLLGEWRETAAYRPLVELVRGRPDTAENWLGDAITETAARVLASVCDGDPRPLFDLALDAGADRYARSAAFEALAIAVGHGKLEAAPVALFLRDSFMELRPQFEHFAWYGWQRAIARLGLADLRSLVKKAFDRGFIDSYWLGYDRFLDNVRQSRGPDGGYTWLDNNEARLFGDTVAELQNWICFQPDAVEEPEVASILDIMAEHPLPARNPTRDVGRNDPCPCGKRQEIQEVLRRLRREDPPPQRVGTGVSPV